MIANIPGRVAASPPLQRRTGAVVVVGPAPEETGLQCAAAVHGVLILLRGLMRAYRTCSIAEPASASLLMALRNSCARDIGDLRLAAAQCGLGLASARREEARVGFGEYVAELLEAEKRLLALYRDAIIRSSGRHCVRNALRRQFAARRPQVYALDALANPNRSASMVQH